MAQLIVEVLLVFILQKIKMTWEETIITIRGQEDMKTLVEQAYFHEDLEWNIDNFAKSHEYRETLKLIKKYASQAVSILDVGSGNGISAINFAKQGYQVTAVEPDPSNTVGAGAINILKSNYELDNISIHQSLAEDIQFDDNSFDVVYIRQAMHHAKNLNDFIMECVRVLKPNGLLLTIRDHVILHQNDKKLFLETHPLHKYYGGENAFTPENYRNAILKAGASILRELKYYDSVINYFPKTHEEINNEINSIIENQKKKLRKKLGLFFNIPLVWWLYKQLSGFNPYEENLKAGRMYSYIAIKK